MSDSFPPVLTDGYQPAFNSTSLLMQGMGGAGAGAGGAAGANPVMAILKAYQVASAAIGTFYAAKAQRTQLGMQADQARTESNIASINERRAEMGAQLSLLAGQQEVANRTAQFGAMRGEVRAAQAASGVVRGVGSSAELAASMEAAKNTDSATIIQNSVRAAIGSRVRAADFRRQANAQRIQAMLYDASRRGINPLFQAQQAGLKALMS